MAIPLVDFAKLLIPSIYDEIGFHPSAIRQSAGLHFAYRMLENHSIGGVVMKAMHVGAISQPKSERRVGICSLHWRYQIVYDARLSFPPPPYRHGSPQ